MTTSEIILTGLLITVIVLAILVISQRTVLHEGIGKDQTLYKSFGDRYKSVDNTYHGLDAANHAQNSEKVIGRNVIDSTVDSNQFLPTYAQDVGPRQDFNNLRNSGEYLGNYNPSGGSTRDFDIFATDYDRSLEPGGKNRDSTTLFATNGTHQPIHYRNSTASICETINTFMLHETAITNLMATQFTAEQKLQINNFISILNTYMKNMKTQEPAIAANWVQTSNQTRTSVVDVVLGYAQQVGSNTPDAQNVLIAYAPLKNNSAMTAYVQAMLLSVDMNDAFHDCNGSIIR